MCAIQCRLDSHKILTLAYSQQVGPLVNGANLLLCLFLLIYDPSIGGDCGHLRWAPRYMPDLLLLLIIGWRTTYVECWVRYYGAKGIRQPSSQNGILTHVKYEMPGHT